MWGMMSISLSCASSVLCAAIYNIILLTDNNDTIHKSLWLALNPLSNFCEDSRRKY